MQAHLLQHCIMLYFLYSAVSANSKQDDQFGVLENRNATLHRWNLGSSDKESMPPVEPLAAMKSTIPPTPPPTLPIAAAIDCLFEDNTCHWSSNNQLPMKWLRGLVNSSDMIPPARENSKSYMYIVADDYLGQSPLAELQSYPLLNNASTQQFCFSFNYYAFGVEVGNLSLILQGTGSFLLWKSVESQYDGWKNVEVNVQIPQTWTMSLIFRAETGKSGVMALDDFMISYEICPLSSICQFETRVCPWTADKMSNLTWSFGQGNNTDDPGPPFDHTTLAKDGTYFIIRNDKTVQNGVGWIISPQYGANIGTQCLSFWYYMSGESSETLSVHLRSNEPVLWSDALWRRSGEKGNRWHRAQVTISVYTLFQIGIEAKFINTSQNFFAIDDIKMSPISCDLPASCNFDDGVCGYTIDFNANTGFDWLIGHGRTYNSKKLSGPHTDVRGNGYYAYVDLTNPAVPWEGKAVLRSDTVRPSSKLSYCLQFYYIQYGALPTFAVEYNILNQFEGLTTTVWVNPRQILDQWTKASVSFQTESSADFELLFIVEPGEKNVGFIGLDEINLIPSSECETIPQPTNDTTLETEYYCDFESRSGNTCTWFQKDEIKRWTVEKGRVSGNHFDHTKNNEKGHFLSAEKSWSAEPASICNRIKTSGYEDKCFMFWYFMYGSVDWFNITLEHDQGQVEVLWQRLGNQGAAWRYAQIPLQTIHSVNICINAQISYKSNSIIAVDDLNILKSPCLPQRMCTFDDGHICDFKQEIGDEFDWDINKESNDLLPTDHTLQTAYGKYMYINSTGRTDGDSASLISGRYPPGENGCLRFWYYMSNELSELGIVYAESDKTLNFIALFNGGLANDWVSAAVPFKPTGGDWQLYIRGVVRVFGTINSNFTNVDIAIDDVTISLNDDCASAVNCNFESVDSMWYASSTSEEYMWTRTSAEEHSYREGYPKTDHTLGLPSGFFLCLDTMYYGLNEQEYETKLSSSILESGVLYRCLSFWYYASGNINGSFIVSGLTTEKKLLLEKTEINTNMKWNAVHVIIPGLEGNMQLIIEPYFQNMLGILAIDDIQLYTEDCEDIPFDTFSCNVSNMLKNFPISAWCNYVQDCDDGSDEANCGNCTFEDGQCSYYSTDLTNSWHLLTAKSGHEEDPRYAPSNDATFGNETGHYMLATENSDYQSENAELMSPIIEKTSPTCHMSFWLYESKLKTYNQEFEVALTFPILDVERDLYDSTYFYGPASGWKNGILYIGNEEKFSMKFIKSTETYAATSLDDITFISCGFSGTEPNGTLCPDDQFKCDTGQCIDNSKLCDFAPDCSDNSDELYCNEFGYLQCDFETSDCGWEELETGKMWKVDSSDDAGSYSLSFDHTKGEGGSYMIANSWDEDYFRTGSLVFKSSKNCTMSLYYYVHSQEQAVFRILTRNFINGDEKLILERTRYYGEFYLREEVTFNEEQNFQIILQANVSDYNTFVIVDDISFSPECSNTTELLPNATRPACCDGFFSCGNGLYVPMNNVCNFWPDCTNSLDEAECGSCDFSNKSLCGWTDSSAGMFRWVDGSMPHIEYYSSTEALGALKRPYIMVNRTTISHTFLPPAILTSPVLGRTSRICKMKFLLQLNNEISMLELLYLNSSMNNAWIHLLTLEGNSNWTTVITDIGDLPANTQIAFQANLTSNAWRLQMPGIKITDISFINCSRRAEEQFIYPSNANCSFEGSTCSWYQDHLSDDLDWNLAENYIYLINEKAKKLVVGRLKSALLPKMLNDSCLMFSYMISGELSDTLNVLTLLQNKETAVLRWNVINTKEQSWRKVELNIKSNDSFQIMFEGVMQNFGNGKIAIKNVVLQPGRCTDPSTFCNFEADDCGWKTLTWKRGHAHSGDINDHTSGQESGSYLYATKSFESDENSLQSVYSPWYFSSLHGSCFQMFYAHSYMFGYSCSLETIVHYSNGYKTNRKIFIDSKNSHDWSIDETNILPGMRYLIELKASLSGYDAAVIAVDDTQIVNTKCQPLGSCNFEYHQCGWESIESYENQIYWMRSSGSTPSDVTGPKTDHTFQNEKGYYMLIEADDGLEGYRGILQSPLLNYNDSLCFSFYYHMYGRDVGALYISLTSREMSYNLYSLKGNQGSTWQHMQLEIYKSENEFQLEIIAEIGAGKEGDIAIDDISIMKGSCNLSFPDLPLSTETVVTTDTVAVSTIDTTLAGSSLDTTSFSIRATKTTFATTTKLSYDTSTKETSGTSAETTPLSTMTTTLNSLNNFTSKTSSHGWIAGVVILCIAVILILGLYIRKRRSKSSYSDTSESNGLDNPCYDGIVPDDYTIQQDFVYTEVDTCAIKKADVTDGISNPLFESD